MKQLYYDNIKLSALDQGIMRWCEGKNIFFSGYSVYDPNSLALPINYGFNSASKSGLKGNKKGLS